jgi:hypothetical protein
MLIPIVGRMVMFGYLIGRYAKVSEGKEVEDFDSNFFGNAPRDVRACVRTRE